MRNQNPNDKIPVPDANLAFQTLTSVLENKDNVHNYRDRISAALALGDLINTEFQSEIIEALCNSLKNDTSKTVRKSAAMAIGRIGMIQAMHTLITSSLSEKEDDVKTEIINSIYRIGGEKAILRYLGGDLDDRNLYLEPLQTASTMELVKELQTRCVSSLIAAWLKVDPEDPENESGASFIYQNGSPIAQIGLLAMMNEGIRRIGFPRDDIPPDMI